MRRTSLEATLDPVHAAARCSRWLGRFAVLNRVLLAAAFLPAGLTKLLGHRFTSLGVDTPVGYFIDAFYRAGGWYHFVGAAQVLAAVLLLLPWTGTLGAVLYFPIITNIFVITVAVGFQGTPFITGPMSLACLYLLAWDYHRWKGILFADAAPAP